MYFYFQKSNQNRPTIKNNKLKKSDIVVDQVLLQANELVRQSSIEPKKYIQNQLMFKKNKEIGCIENSVEFISPSQKHVKQISADIPELFSSPDIITKEDNKTSIETENKEFDLKTNIVEKINNTVVENTVSNVLKDKEKINVNKDESIKVRKISIRTKDNPTEMTVTKTVEDILNDISSKVANEPEDIDEENLIDVLADLNEDLNSVCSFKLFK